MKRILISGVSALLLLIAPATAHPHFSKTVTAGLDGVEAVITYRTVPSNEEHTRSAAAGTFVTPRGPRLTLSAAVQAGDVSLPAGEYTIGAIKNSDGDWTMALYPGQIARGSEPDMSKMIRLDSFFSTTHGTAEHLVVDISPGHGKHEGKAVLVLHFGSLHLTGALS